MPCHAPICHCADPRRRPNMSLAPFPPGVASKGSGVRVPEVAYGPSGDVIILATAYGSAEMQSVSNAVRGSATSRRLNSWKEVATYFQRDERTVKRWEAARGLPVHRAPGQARSKIYAYTRELDAWFDDAPET